jgi:rare lipoprotein A
MHQQLFSSLTATFLVTTLGTATSATAEPAKSVQQNPDAVREATRQSLPQWAATSERTCNPADCSLPETTPTQATAKPKFWLTEMSLTRSVPGNPIPANTAPAQTLPANNSGRSPEQPQATAQPAEVIQATSKVTSQNPQRSPDQPQATAQPAEVIQAQQPAVKQSVSEAAIAKKIAKIHPHEMDQRNAATLYVRNIPVLTFLGAATANKSNGDADPVRRASTLATQLNQMNLNSIDASRITVSWNPLAQQSKQPEGDRPQERYSIKLGNVTLATVDGNTILSATTRNLETDALEATNLLRRLLGNAAPLTAVAGKPKPKPKPMPVVVRPAIRFHGTGYASWYGPGFDGNMSASGEIFNENALTAAHRTLPFGTRVLVTNLDNKATVVVRINDRGPFYDDRIIDLSLGAARVVGLVDAGVAPVRLDILDDRGTIAGTR